MEYILLWIVFAIFSAAIASSRGRSGFGWFLVGLFFGPFGLLVVAFPKLEKVATVPPNREPYDFSGGYSYESIESLAKDPTLSCAGIAIKKNMEEHEVESQIMKMYQAKKLTKDETERVLGRALTSTEVQDTKECPFCAETIKVKAIVCRYCGKDLTL